MKNLKKDFNDGETLNFTDNQMPKKLNNKKSYYRHKYLLNRKTFCAPFCALFARCLRDSFQPFCQWKKFLSSGNKVFRVDINFIKEIHFNLETSNWEAFCLEYCKVKAFCFEYCLKSSVLNYRTCLVASEVKERRWNKNKQKKMSKWSMQIGK